MTGFKVKIEGLDILKKDLEKYSDLRNIVPDITLAILKFHNSLENRVGTVYTAKQNLSSVMIGNSGKPASISKTLLRYSLQYRYKPIELIEFNPQVNPSNAISKAPLKKPNGLIKWTKGKWSKTVTVEPRRGRRKIGRLTTNSKFKVFYIGDSLVARIQQATWNKFPTKGFAGVRAPVAVAFGPSLSQQAEKLFNTDPRVKDNFSNMQTEIINSFLKYYQ